MSHVEKLPPYFLYIESMRLTTFYIDLPPQKDVKDTFILIVLLIY